MAETMLFIPRLYKLVRGVTLINIRCRANS